MDADTAQLQLHSEMTRDRRCTYSTFSRGMSIIYTILCGTTTNVVIIQKCRERNWDKLFLIGVSCFHSYSDSSPEFNVHNYW